MKPFLPRITQTTLLRLTLASTSTSIDAARAEPTTAAVASAPVDASPAATPRNPATGIDDALLRTAGSEPANCITHGRDYAEQRFSPLEQVNDKTVQRLARESRASTPA